MRLYLSILLGLVAMTTLAQSIQNVKATPQDGKVIVLYDLIGGKPEQKYTIDLFASHNNFSAPLTEVSGDVGKNITPGTGKKIIWDAALELTTYKGDITFKVKGEAITLPFAFKKPAKGGSVRRGKNTSVEWEGGKPTQHIKLELYKGTELVNSIAETGNTGQYNWSIPKKTSKGSYTLKLNAGQETVNSQPFKIKSKIPFIVKMLPVVVVGGVVAVFVFRCGDCSTSNDLPIAPDPPN